MDDDLQSLIEELAPALAAAFLAAIAMLRSGINFDALLIALRAKDIDAAIDALNIESGAFSRYVMEKQSGFVEAGSKTSEMITENRAAAMPKRDSSPALRSPVLEPPTVAPTPDEPRQPSARMPGVPDELPPVPAAPVRRTPAVPSAPGSGEPPAPPPGPPTLEAPGGGQVIFRFDMANPRAEAKIRTEAASRVAGYVDEQIETARRVIADGFQRGEGPTTIATDIAGRVNPISKRREGGIVGLSDPQVTYVDSMRARLLSGDPDEMMKVLGRFDKEGKWIEGTGQTLRDRRYDGKIKKAIRDVAAGKLNPLTRDQVDEMTAKYSDRLLARRADDIARTETAQGVMSARAEATKQAIDKGGLADTAVTKTWRHLGGLHHARDWHVAMSGKSVTGIDAVFFMPDGSVMKHSHDPDGGAKNNVACRCGTDFDVDWSWGL